MFGQQKGTTMTQTNSMKLTKIFLMQALVALAFIYPQDANAQRRQRPQRPGRVQIPAPLPPIGHHGQQGQVKKMKVRVMQDVYGSATISVKKMFKNQGYSLKGVAVDKLVVKLDNKSRSGQVCLSLSIDGFTPKKAKKKCTNAYEDKITFDLDQMKNLSGTVIGVNISQIKLMVKGGSLIQALTIESIKKAHSRKVINVQVNQTIQTQGVSLSQLMREVSQQAKYAKVKSISITAKKALGRGGYGQQGSAGGSLIVKGLGSTLGQLQFSRFMETKSVFVPYHGQTQLQDIYLRAIGGVQIQSIKIVLE